MPDETTGPPPAEEGKGPSPRGLPTHIDIPRLPEHADIPTHADVPRAPQHADLPAHVDIQRVPRHIDVPVHADLPQHFDIAHLHSDVPAHADLNRHSDVGHLDIRHMDLPRHTDVGSSGHIDLGHGDVPIPHVDSGPPPPPPPPHVDAAPAHVDIGYNHWWQNWPKTHGYVAKRMLFPTTVEEVATGVKMAEADGMPLRAVGGGWSFSDASLPGNVGPSLTASPTTGRPNVSTSDSIDQFLPLAEGFPADDQPSIACYRRGQRVVDRV